ncbi:MAG: bifunctional riboflavin kinase/FAD synthetase [Candidatus Omnitrophota bacterium]
MKIIYGITGIRKYKRPVAALGVFDGVHRGHRNILKTAVAEARNINGTSIVLTFWPHPQKEESLYSLPHRLKLIEELGVDVCIVINFNKKFAGVTAADFITGILIEKLRVHAVYVGENFRFGKNAEGDANILKQFSKTYNFKLKIFKIIRVKHDAVSSTYIRNLIRQGELRAAGKLLGRPVSVLGTVIRGISLAKQLGFPTANINPHHEVLPPPGVYSAAVFFNKHPFMGVCYIGTKPTINHRPRVTGKKPRDVIHVEAHIFDFHQNIYGKDLEIQFIKKIRNERKFNTLEFLSKQIKKDVIYAKAQMPSTN